MENNQQPQHNEVPAGTHDLTVQSSQLEKTSTGKERVSITFVDPHGRTTFWDGYFTEKAYPQTEKALQNLDWDPRANGFRFDMLNGTPALVGRKATCVVQDEQYEGQNGTWNYTRVRWINRLGDNSTGMRERMPENEATAFAQRMAARFGAGAPQPVPPTQPMPPLGQPPKADDIPF